MGNCILASPALSDAATITGSTAASGAPLSYLQRMQPGEVWQSSSLSSVYMEADLGSAKEIDLVALLFNNATSEGLWRIRAATSQANLTAAPTYDSGQALSLDGSTQHASHAGLTAPTSFTIEALFRPDTTSLGTVLQVHDGSAYQVSILATGGTFNVYDGTTLIVGGQYAARDLTHVAVVFGGGSVQFFVNGVLIGSAATTFAFSPTVTVAVGATTFPATGSRLDGAISLARYWTIARTAEQIAANMRTALGATTGMVGQWEFNGAATNSGSAGGSATLTGSPSYVLRERMWASGSLDNFTRRHSMLWMRHGGRAASSVSARWWRLDFTDASNPDSAIRAGRLYLAKAYQPAINFTYGAPLYQFDDPSVREILPGGQTSVTRFGNRPHYGPIRMQAQSEDELYGDLYEIVRTRGSSRDVLFVSDPDESPRRFQRMIYGLMAQRIGPVRTSWGQYETPIEFDGLE